MMYHLQVNGKLVWKNMTRRKAMEYFEIARVLRPGEEISVLMTEKVEVV